MAGFFKAVGLDQYQRAAHLNPAIPAVLPVFATVTLWFPAESKLISGLVSLTASVALAVLLMQFGRARGRAVEGRMKARLDGLASTRALRFSDDLIAGETKRRYHEFLASRGITMPVREQELADPAAADDLYRSACDRLSLESQHLEAQRYADRMGYDLINVVVEAGKSAINARRPVLQKLVSDAGQRPTPFDIVIVWNLSRYFRNLVESEMYRERFAKRSV